MAVEDMVGEEAFQAVVEIAREMVISPRNPRLGLTTLVRRLGMKDRPDSIDGELLKYKWDDPNVVPADMTIEVSELFSRELTKYIQETEEVAINGISRNRHILNMIVTELMENSRMTGLLGYCAGASFLCLCRRAWYGEGFFSAVYQVWRGRNAKVHHGEVANFTVMATTIVETLSVMRTLPLQGRWGTTQPRRLSTPHFWCPPPPGWIKFNVDGSLSPSGLAGLGMVACDDRGALIFDAGFPLLHWDPGGVELAAVLALRNLIPPSLYGVCEAIVVGDCSSLMDSCAASLRRGDWSVTVDDKEDFSFLSGFPQLLFQHIGREASRAADFYSSIRLVVTVSVQIQLKTFARLPRKISDYTPSVDYTYFYTTFDFQSRSVLLIERAHLRQLLSSTLELIMSSFINIQSTTHTVSTMRLLPTQHQCKVAGSSSSSTPVSVPVHSLRHSCSLNPLITLHRALSFILLFILSPLHVACRLSDTDPYYHPFRACLQTSLPIIVDPRPQFLPLFFNLAHCLVFLLEPAPPQRVSFEVKLERLLFESSLTK
ncbi:hypothetical protein KSP40_PGU016023 [Platanthera guangdongensis]|uniref:RNase H type-1 domain-containing protein n=1 Tax=Platanthera guangdongensis TaxID=2320717 RepID=A0ABR2MDU6_9ASPA